MASPEVSSVAVWRDPAWLKAAILDLHVSGLSRHSQVEEDPLVFEVVSEVEVFAAFCLSLVRQTLASDIAG